MNRLHEQNGRDGKAHAVEQLPAVAPSPNGHDGADRGDGRTARGRFAKGNAGGPGNPFARKTAALRSALINGLTDENMQAVAGKLLEMALAGDLDAARL